MKQQPVLNTDSCGSQEVLHLSFLFLFHLFFLLTLFYLVNRVMVKKGCRCGFTGMTVSNGYPCVVKSKDKCKLTGFKWIFSKSRVLWQTVATGC